MRLGRLMGGLASSGAVAACALLVVAAGTGGLDRTSDAATPTSSEPAVIVSPPAPMPSGDHSTVSPPSHPASSAAAVTSSPSSPSAPQARHTTPSRAPTAAPARTTGAASRAPAPRATTTAPRPTPATSTARAVTGGSLPLTYSTGSATRVITVTASATWSTTATLQAWQKAPGGGWLKYGSAVTAHIGSQGMTTSPSESRSATPMGSFTLTQAFGRYSDPGTPLPYFRTTPSDWWISQAGTLYNTHQRCASGCAFNLGSPNEHLYYETPYYNYAVVIDYNTRNAPGGVRQGAGSAFFLHVTDGRATAGCVAITQSKLVTLMRWLSPSTHPRILIGTR